MDVEKLTAWLDEQLQAAESSWIDTMQELWEDGHDVPDSKQYHALWIAERLPHYLAATALQSSVGGEVAKYEWFDSVAGVWKPVNRLPYTWEAELGIPWRASTLTASPAQPSDGWRTMDSAPNSGEVVMFHVAGQERPHMGRGDDWHGGFAYWLKGATHWRPLPAPPLTAAPSAPLDVAGGGA